jgi:nucleotide-binding universal stress UspA family protein
MPATSNDRLHILLTTDGSERSLDAIEPVCNLARRMSARITLLRVTAELGGMSQTGFKTPLGVVGKLAEMELANAKLDLAGAVARFQGVPVEVQVAAADSAVDGILRYAQTHQVDLIAMATHGRGGLSRLLMGSTAEAVLRQSKIPVLVIPGA